MSKVLTHENIENISEISEYPIGIGTYTRMSDRSWLDSTQSHFTITLKFLYELDMEFCALEKILLSFSPPLSIFNNGKYFFKAKANIFVSYDIQWMRKCVVKKDNQSFIHFLSVEFRESSGEEKGENATTFLSFDFSSRHLILIWVNSDFTKKKSQPADGNSRMLVS